MFGHNFYHGIVEKYTAVMLTLFNDITITRSIDGEPEQAFRVPVTLAPKDKSIVRTEQDPNIDRPAALVLPMMTLELRGMRYRKDDKLSTTGKWVGKRSSNKNVASSIYNPVPYDFFFDLSIQAKNVADGLKIMEQILPFFTPDWTPTVKLISDPEIKIDVPIVIDPIDLVDTYSVTDFDEGRVIGWKLGFTLKGFLYGPNIGRKIIKTSRVNVTSGNTDIDPVITVTVQPGLTSDGEPTSNSDLTVPLSQISWDDNYGIIVTIEDENLG